MAAISWPKGKTKVLTSNRARETGAVDPELQMTADEYHEVKMRRNQQKSQFDWVESSRAGAMRHRPTSQILLNKWQRQQEKDYQRWLDEENCRRRREEETHEKEQNKSHWNCLFFKHCQNESLKLPTRNNCPECSDQYWEYRQSRTNCRSVYKHLDHPQDMDRRIKRETVHDRLWKKVVNQDLADYENKEYVWQDGQWCPGGLTRSQKRRVQRLRNTELEEEKRRPQVWCVKQTADKGGPSADISAAFMLPVEFRAPIAQLVFQAESAIFDKLKKYLHLKALYLKGFIDGKPKQEKPRSKIA